MIVKIPMRTQTSGTNLREHWGIRHRRVRAERETVAWALKPFQATTLPARVRLTRQGPSNGLDGDNLQGSLKAVRDQVAAWLGVDDRSALIAWEYAQERRKEWAVWVDVAEID